MFSGLLLAQPTYYMSNMIVDDCKGFLLDSENGDIGGTYDHNENYTFTVCIPGSGDILLEFQEFCTEESFDFIRIFDGPDTLSNLVFGPHSGEEEPPSFTFTNGCFTVHFISDPNVSCTGWIAEWSVEVEEPLPPDILPIGTVPCETSSMTITFDEPIPCDSIFVEAFSLLGPQIPPISNVSPSPCSGGTTTNVLVEFGAPLATSGNYQITYTTYEYDECGELYTLRASEDFLINDCPLFVTLEAADDPVCAGECTSIQAEATGGIAGSYVYQWSAPIQSDSAVAIVCPLATSIYTLTVTDALGSSVVDSITLMVNPAPVIDNGDQLICQSLDTLFLTATPSGGNWSGDGISEMDELTGWYNPDLVEGLLDTVTYTDDNGCSSSVAIELIPLDEGNDDAACPGSDPFQVSGGLPEGGSWSGPLISADGIFSPPDTAGSFEVTYTHPNGCSGSKWINVDTITIPMIDTLCQSVDAFALPVTPFGGTWDGPGIIDSDNGIFDPDSAAVGSNSLVYTINGCVDSMSIFIKEINAAYDFAACPAQLPFIVPGNWQPAGGVWQGLGIVDSLTGLYDPSLLTDGSEDTLTYVADGCAANRIVYVVQTDIQISDTLDFCTGDEVFYLDRENTGRRPGNGTWSGAGINNPDDDEWLFNPAQAGAGLYTLYYDANTCVDSLMVEVFSSPQIMPGTYCEEEEPITLQSTPAGGYWSGNGITNNDVGVFDPGVAGSGNHTINLVSLDGCYGENEINVIAFEEATIGIDTANFCYKDSIIDLQLSPEGGELTIGGEPASAFNPAMVGPGTHALNYTFGSGSCFSETTLLVTIGNPVELSLPFDQDTLCYGESTTLSAQGSGGTNPTNYTYTWNQGLGFGNTQLVTPLSPTTYTVSVGDGCSDPAIGNINIFVHPEITTSYQTGPRVCFEDSTTAVITAAPGNDFSFEWDSEPPTFGPSIVSYPTTYTVEVFNNETNCAIDIPVTLPGYPPITANFGLNPNVECLSSLNTEVDILDFSVGGQSGYWDFGDGSARTPYIPGQSPEHIFPDTGNYTVRLYIENEGDCSSEFELEVCIRPEHRLFAPNAFTPGIDGVNDEFRFKGVGIADIRWLVFDRWGQHIFEGQGMEESWNGIYKGRYVPPGVYTYIARFKTEYSDQEQVMTGYITVVY